MSFDIVEVFKNKVRDAMESSIKAKNLLASDKINIAIVYLNQAISFMSSAETMYYCNFDVLARNEAEDIFFRFKIFTNEFLKNYETNHSHQWTYLEFNKLKDDFDNSAFRFPY